MAFDEMIRRNLANSGQAGSNSSDSDPTGLSICDGSIGPQYCRVLVLLLEMTTNWGLVKAAGRRSLSGRFTYML